MDGAAAIVPYAGNDPVPSGSEYGIYTFFLNEGTLPVESNENYPASLTITSPTEGKVIVSGNNIVLTWNNIGSNYEYLVTASTPEDNNNNYAKFWASQDITQFSQQVPPTFQTLINNGLSTNTVTIPASVFTSGDTVEFMVAAIDKTALSFSDGTATCHTAQYRPSYPSANRNSPSNNRSLLILTLAHKRTLTGVLLF